DRMLMKTILGAVFVILVLGWGVVLAQDEKRIPEKPTHLRAFTRFDGATAVAELSWHDESDNELSFEILRSDNGKEFRVVGMVGANTMKYDDKVGKYITGAFAYKVRAFNEAGRSEDSNIVSVWF
ncbi:hypothetical protein MYX78_11280, partial [Acidobacteria bacterium AH-259-G07]|nr:hypothetical protein [Acidobacteria bacterium AH-259-G07]